MIRATSKSSRRAEHGAGDATVQGSTPGGVDSGNELSSIEPGALTEATEASGFDTSQLAAAGSSPEYAASLIRRHAHVILKTGGVVPFTNNSVGIDQVRSCAATLEADNSDVPVADEVDAAVGDDSDVRRRGKLSVSRSVGVVKLSICRVGVLRKVDRKTGADGTAGSGDFSSEDSLFRAA